MKNRKGFTLLEVIIVITLIGIIGALIIPNFIDSTIKTKLKSDIESARIIQNAIDLYNIEQGTPISNSDVDTIITELNNKGYIKQVTYKPQIEGAIFVYNQSESMVKLDITNATDNIVQEIIDELSLNEKDYVIQ